MTFVRNQDNAWDNPAKDLFDRLTALHPDRFSDGQLRTLQRRVRQWRAVMARQLVYGGPDDAQPWEIAPIGAEVLPSARTSASRRGEANQREKAEP